MSWLAVLEIWATTRLLSSPAFHRAVQNAYRKFHRLRHGTPMEEMGEGPSFFKHFINELRDQIRGGPPRR